MISVRLADEVYLKLKTRAKARELTVSEYVRRLMADDLEHRVRRHAPGRIEGP